MKNRVYRYTVKRTRVAESLAKLCSPRDVATLAQRLIGSADRENFIAIYLDSRNAIVGWETVAIGTLTGVEVHPREVFRGAIVAGAVAIVVAHNHPSGDPSPSAEDNVLTDQLRKAGELIGIPVLDHVIVAEQRVYSYAERDWR